MSVHYSPQTSVIRNVTVGKTPITVNVSSVERGSDSSIHTVSTSNPSPSTINEAPMNFPSATAQERAAFPSATAQERAAFPSVAPGIVAPPPFPPQMPIDRGCDIGYTASASNGASAFHDESIHNAELEGIVHQTFANMALQHQSSRLRKLTGNHIILPKEDLITIIAYTVGCQPAEVRINRGFSDIGCFEKREKVSLIDSIKVGVKDLYLAYNEKYNLLEDVYHISLKYCFDADAGKVPRGVVYV